MGDTEFRGKDLGPELSTRRKKHISWPTTPQGIQFCFLSIVHHLLSVGVCVHILHEQHSLSIRVLLNQNLRTE